MESVGRLIEQLWEPVLLSLYAVIARSKATKQSSFSPDKRVDCFAALAMTTETVLFPLARRPLRIALPQRLQPGFDLRTASFEKWRQREFFAERFHRLVGGKTRSVGGDLK
jgi:hypothetical protein